MQGTEREERDGGWPAGAGPAHDDPLDRLASEHAVQLELCDALEFIADGLPHHVDRGLVREVIPLLTRGLAGHFDFEEQALFPVLRKRGAAEIPLIAALNQLEAEHTRDEDGAIELADELQALAEQGQARNPEMVGYMLRGYFESQRRHIKWENAVVLPAARRILSAADLQELSLYMERKPSRLTRGRP